MLSNNLSAIKISSSKYKTYKFFQKNSIPTLKTFNFKKKISKLVKNGLPNVMMEQEAKKIIFSQTKKIYLIF